MIDKIHFSLNIFIYLINMLIFILFFKIKFINLSGSNLTNDFISEMENMNEVNLGYSLFLVIYSLVFIVIYQEVYGNNILKDFFINIFYITTISSMIFNNHKIIGNVKIEQNKFALNYLDIPNNELDNIICIFYYIQGFLFLIISLTIIKGFVTFYRGAKNIIITYFQNGGNIFYFETSHILS